VRHAVGREAAIAVSDRSAANSRPARAAIRRCGRPCPMSLKSA